MATVIRAELSEKNKYYIDKHRHYELKHFCLQYPTWKRKYAGLGNLCVVSQIRDISYSNNKLGDPTGTCAVLKAQLLEKIELVEKIAKEADNEIHEYILKAVTEGLSFPYLKTNMNIPCGKDMYYDRYRKFFWLLSEARD